MVDNPEKLPTLLQSPHSGMDEAQMLEHWNDLVRNVFAQALVRYMSREEVEAAIPEDMAPYINIEERGDMLLVIAIQQPAAVDALNEICACDSVAMRMHAIDDDG